MELGLSWTNPIDMKLKSLYEVTYIYFTPCTLQIIMNLL